MNLFKKKQYITMKSAKSNDIPSNWVKCNKCKKTIYIHDLVREHHTCGECGYHFRMAPRDRINYLMDEGSFKPLFEDVVGGNPLDFKGYEDKVKVNQIKSKETEAVSCGVGAIKGNDVVIAFMNPQFMMGSMGKVVGERLALAVEYATEHRLPVIIYSASGGARMQEGIVSLMQMAKTSAALKRHDLEQLLSIVVLTDPTTGGVTASFAMLGDVIIAEPEALIGFAGPRVIEQTIRQKLPEGFQRAEFLLEHGFVDKIVPRSKQRDMLGQLLSMH